MTEAEPGIVTKALRDYRQTESPEAFAVLYERIADYVKVIAQRRLTKTSKLMDVDDVIQSVMLLFIKGMRTKKTWFVETALNQESLRGMLYHMTVLRCLRIYRYENAKVRRIIRRDADGSTDCASSSSYLADPQSQHEVEIQFDQIIEMIRAGLAAEHPTQGTELVRVFDGLLAYMTVPEIAETLNRSERTVNRRALSVRMFVAKQIEQLGLDFDLDSWQT